LDLWLYISHAPCGDSAIFSGVDPKPVAIGPIFQTAKHGKLRVKTESTQGTRVAQPITDVQSVDGLQFGERARSHSCSDKIAKWAVLGVQGALLTRLIPPVALKGVVISIGFSHGHACRALCCRSARAFKNAETAMPLPFKLQHLKICEAQILKSRHLEIENTKKLGNISVNWAEGDESVEITDSRTGCLMNGADPTNYSRISKRALFGQFASRVPLSLHHSYAENKNGATEYQRGKGIWLRALSDAKFGSWISKPEEFEDFKLLDVANTS
jgi:hypothetical protein